MCLGATCLEGMELKKRRSWVFWGVFLTPPSVRNSWLRPCRSICKFKIWFMDGYRVTIRMRSAFWYENLYWCLWLVENQKEFHSFLKWSFTTWRQKMCGKKEVIAIIFKFGRFNVMYLTSDNSDVPSFWPTIKLSACLFETTNMKIKNSIFWALI